jgi:SAM-dependent methyltransferase
MTDIAAFQKAALRHLPPSASELRLVDAGGGVGAALANERADLAVLGAAGADGLARLPEASADAVTFLGAAEDALREQALRVLRPGGRFIAIDPAGKPSAEHVAALERAGFTRVLVEAAVVEPQAQGVLMRGERPHTTADTLARVEGVAGRDAAFTDWSAFRGRYVHVLVRVMPDKPDWTRAPDEPVQWLAAAVEQEGRPALLAFSSLPNAVAFMQQAVLAGALPGINKVGKFTRAEAEQWPQTLLFNPAPAVLSGGRALTVPLDPARAVTGEE